MVMSPCIGTSTLINCVSIMSLNKPGWFVLHSGSNVTVQPESNPANPDTFEQDASFVVRTNHYAPDFISLESLNLPGYFFSTSPGNNNQNKLFLAKVDDSSEFDSTTCFQFHDLNSQSNLTRSKTNLTGELSTLIFCIDYVIGFFIYLFIHSILFDQ